MIYYVIGGEHTDMTFTSWARTPDNPEVLGPFFNKEEANRTWKERSMKHVDNCLTRYTIKESKE